MNASNLRELTLSTLNRNSQTEPENPVFDSLDKLEIISAIHDEFGSKVADIDGLDEFADFDGLYKILKQHNVVD